MTLAAPVFSHGVLGKAKAALTTNRGGCRKAERERRSRQLLLRSDWQLCPVLGQSREGMHAKPGSSLITVARQRIQSAGTHTRPHTYIHFSWRQKTIQLVMDASNSARFSTEKLVCKCLFSRLYFLVYHSQPQVSFKDSPPLFFNAHTS